MKTRKKILFILHSASRNGASILLLHFLKWFKTNTDIPFEILVKNVSKGNRDLISEFKKLAPYGLKGKILSWIGSYNTTKQIYRGFFKEKLRRKDIGLIYINSVASGDVLATLSHYECPVIAHVHENEYSLHFFLQSNLRYIQKHASHYIAVSGTTRNTLTDTYGISDKEIDTVHGFLPLSNGDSVPTKEAALNIRKELDIPSDALVVGASGSIADHKGSDLFVQLAYRISQVKGCDIPYFIWVGKCLREDYFNSLQHDIKKTGLKKHVFFIGQKSNPLDYFNIFDIFASVSRADSYPLSVLEAASLGKPIVCFAGSGGSVEFVNEDCGFVVPYLDVDKMAAKVLELLTNKELRAYLGERAQKKALQENDVKIAAPKILNVIKRFL
ncbi:MAG: glycosyltransferase family 4 protein [Candidatus Omnitrophota bacterium]